MCTTQTTLNRLKQPKIFYSVATFSHKCTWHINSPLGVFDSSIFDCLRQSPKHMITKMMTISINTAATATTTYSHTCTEVVAPMSVELSVEVGDVGGLLVSEEVEAEVTSPVVTVGGGVGRGLMYTLGCDVTSVWVVDVISNMGVAVTEGEGSLVIGKFAQLGSVWKNVFDGQSGSPGLFSCSSTKETLGMVCDVSPFILN